MARPPSKKPRKYEVETLWDIHCEVLRMLSVGSKPKDISKALGISTQQISNLRNSTIAQELIQKYRGARDAEVIDINARIKDMSPKALDRLEQILDDPDYYGDHRLVAQTARDILDRAGHGGIQKSATVHAVMTPDKIKELKERAQNAGVMVNVDYTEIENEEEGDNGKLH